MEEWVKLYTTYADDVAIAACDDAGEVMFTRGLAYCGRAKTGGFVPDGKLQDLTRRPTRARAIVTQLTRNTPLGEPGPWEQIPGGYRIRRWSHYQEQFDALSARRKSDRDRQTKKRELDKAKNTAGSRDLSRDNSRDVTHPEKREKKKAAAAASASGPIDLPPAVAILRSALEARKLKVRWDRLTADELVEIEALVAEKGDAALVKSSLAEYQPDKPPVYAKAWLEGWRQARPPGDLRVVPDTPCPEPGHSGTTKHCTQCASEALATPKENP